MIVEKKVIIYSGVKLSDIAQLIAKYRTIESLQDKIGRPSVAIIPLYGLADEILYFLVYQTKTAYIIRKGK